MFLAWLQMLDKHHTELVRLAAIQDERFMPVDSKPRCARSSNLGYMAITDGVRTRNKRAQDTRVGFFFCKNEQCKRQNTADTTELTLQENNATKLRDGNDRYLICFSLSKMTITCIPSRFNLCSIGTISESGKIYLPTREKK